MSAAPLNKPSMTIYEKFDYEGKHFPITESTPDINSMLRSGSHRGLSSFIVDKGIWKMYTEVNYGGDPLEIDGKTELGPGKYNFKSKDLRKLNDKLQSIELISPPPHITLYTTWHFSEGDVDLGDSKPDISADFPKGRKGLSSFIVHAGKWSLYTEANYEGEVVDIHGVTVFGPGKYELRGKGIRKFNDDTVSIKLVEY